MQTLVLTENFPPRTGGSGRWFWETYRRLPREKFLIAAGTHEQQEKFDASHDLRVNRIPLDFQNHGLIGFAGFQSYARAYRHIARIISSEGIDNLHCGRCLPEGLLAWAMQRTHGIRYCCYVHGEDVGAAATSRELTFLTRRVMASAEFLLVNSRNTERIVQRHWAIPADRIRLFHPGVDTNTFVPLSRNAVRRCQLGWGERPVILTASRLQKRKGHDIMIVALLEIRKMFPNILYVIAGDGAERAELASICNRQGLGDHVQFMGEVNESTLIECYQQCDLFALPNRQIGNDFEGFGMVLLEAQACGKPVLAGASGGTAETMQIPKTGRVVNCEEPEVVAAAVIDLLSHPARLGRMGEAARNWVVDRFDWSVVLEHAEEVFQMPGPQRVISAAPACM